MSKIELTKEQGNRIKQLCRAKGYTLENIAKINGLSNTKMSFVINGHKEIDLETLENIAKQLDGTAEWILKGGEIEIDMPVATIGQRLRKKIMEKFPRISDFSDYAGIDRNLVSYWINDAVIPSSDMLILLHKALGISIDWLLMGD